MWPKGYTKNERCLKRKQCKVLLTCHVVVAVPAAAVVLLPTLSLFRAAPFPAVWLAANVVRAAAAAAAPPDVCPSCAALFPVQLHSFCRYPCHKVYPCSLSCLTFSYVKIICLLCSSFFFLLSFRIFQITFLNILFCSFLDFDFYCKFCFI